MTSYDISTIDLDWRSMLWESPRPYRAYVRALNPNITFTEKPMEFAFLNSVLRTGSQPPGDPWLSGYAISYYHFGYVIMAILL